MVRFDSFFIIQRHTIWARKKDYRKKSTLVEGEVYKWNNSFCRVCSSNATSDASIVDWSIERKVTPIGSILQLQVNLTLLVPVGGIWEKALHLEINNTKTLLFIKD